MPSSRRDGWTKSHIGPVNPGAVSRLRQPTSSEDRKSTRLNSSHPSISYAVFCLKNYSTSTELYTHSLHDALPISQVLPAKIQSRWSWQEAPVSVDQAAVGIGFAVVAQRWLDQVSHRSCQPRRRLTIEATYQL